MAVGALGGIHRRASQRFGSQCTVSEWELLPAGGGSSFRKDNSRMKISARNVLKGKVKTITTGVVNSEVIVELPDGQEIVAVVTKSAEEGLALELGKEVYAVIKASNVMLGVD